MIPQRYKVIVKNQGVTTNEGGGHTMDDALAWYETHRTSFPAGHTYEFEDNFEANFKREEKIQARKDLKKKLKALKDEDWKAINTIVEVKQILKEIVDILED